MGDRNVPTNLKTLGYAINCTITLGCCKAMLRFTLPFVTRSIVMVFVHLPFSSSKFAGQPEGRSQHGSFGNPLSLKDITQDTYLATRPSKRSSLCVNA